MRKYFKYLSDIPKTDSELARELEDELAKVTFQRDLALECLDFVLPSTWNDDECYRYSEFFKNKLRILFLHDRYDYEI